MQQNWYTTWAPVVARVLLALIFLVSGFNKLMNFESTVAYTDSVGFPMATAAVVAAIIIEILGGLSVLIGYKARWGAAALIVFTIVSAIGFHMDFSQQAQQIQFMKNLAIAGGLLYVTVFGAHRICLDKEEAQTDAATQG